MKLYELERGDRFVLVDETRAPPDIGSYPAGTWLRLGNIDGMYSYCTDPQGKVHHPIAWAEVKKMGFTLIELMIVIVIITILAAIAIPAFQKYKLEQSAVKEQVREQRKATTDEVKRTQ